ncbi:PP2C family serine/threonine-protein phosphatase [Ruficoccus sp. ZRK36]|uniref:PP2C family protein-serine/threonine phosphatase n=1 Tax=Ruficoccus sp. ZRK36 TaxID=2866311 RepID=UPI001C7363D8|nr:PP2C family serine/threonine-protein phosphatase [Ruficoccus sp. ZRK36]QYY35347.1 protein phosphatase 2C domain-containing protein [Ruficoccus sp. ZRK36]
MSGNSDNPPSKAASAVESPVLIYGATDRGLMRSENEDALLVDAKRGFFAVADGLGGLPEGAMASEIAIELLSKWAQQHKEGESVRFRPVFDHINEAVYQRGREISADLGIGTTLTAAYLHARQLTIGHIGDTALVVFKADGTWEQLTQDHTMAQEMLDQLQPGEDAYIPDYFNHTLTRCLGQMGEIKTDIIEAILEPGDRVLIFSDGVTKTHNMDEVQELIFSVSRPQTFVKSLIKTANERGGPDNITAIALFIENT